MAFARWPFIRAVCASSGALPNLVYRFRDARGSSLVDVSTLAIVRADRLGSNRWFRASLQKYSSHELSRSGSTRIGSIRRVVCFEFRRRSQGRPVWVGRAITRPVSATRVPRRQSGALRLTDEPTVAPPPDYAVRGRHVAGRRRSQSGTDGTVALITLGEGRVPNSVPALESSPPLETVAFRGF